MQDKQRARLHEIIEKVNTLFEGDLSEQDKLVSEPHSLFGPSMSVTGRAAVVRLRSFDCVLARAGSGGSSSLGDERIGAASSSGPTAVMELDSPTPA